MIEKDKLYHLLAGFVIYALSSIFFPFGISMGFVTLAAVGKEIYDIKRTGFDIVDLVATIAGGLLAAIIIL